MDKKYTYNEVYESSLKYFNGDELAATTWIKKYCLKNNDETFSELNPDDMHRRMAREFAKIEHNYDHNTDNQLKLSEYGYNRGVLDEDYIYNLFKDFKYVIPGGSVMSGLGSPLPVSLSNCWVIDGPNDSIDDIFRVCNEQSQLMKRRGGVGFDISKLRPYGSIVNNSAKTSTGAVSFMDLFSHVTNTIAQCIEENQRVLTDKGLVKIKNVKIGDYVWTKVGFVKVINNFNNGNKRTFKITTKFGNEIITTEDHIFLTCTQSEIVEKKIKDFNVGEPICILNGTTCDKEYVKLNHNFVKPLRNVSNQYGTYGETVHNQYEDITIPDLLTEKLAYLIGYATGDGYTDKEKNLSVSVNSKDTEIINKLINYVKDVFGIDVYARQKPSENCVIIRICGIEGCSFLLENGLHKPKTEFLRIPKNIFESSSRVQLAYLSGLFDADGYASGSKKGYSFVTVNECLADDIRIMLLSNGILGKKRCEIPNNEKWKPKYSINVVGAYNQQSFVNLMTESIKVTNKNFISKRDNYLSPFTIKNYDISKENFIPNDKYISINALSKSKSYKDGILTQDYINSVEYYGESNVYDLELEKEHLFWCEGFYVHNCGRRGALMLSIDIKHPDAKEFIEKKQDLTKVTGANISVQIDDDFMKCAISENANLYIQKFPIDTTDEELFGNSSFDELWNIYEPNVLYNGKKENTYFKIVNAKDLWNDIIHCAWSTAEPGIIFQSNHHDYSPDGVYPSFRGSCTNPCQPKWATVLTPNGVRLFKDINVGDKIWSENGWTTVVRKINSGIKDVYEYKTTAGTFYGTENHKLLSNGEKIEAKNCEDIDVLAGNDDYKQSDLPEAVVDGLVIGDGSIHKASNDLIYLCIGENDYDYFNSEVSSFIGKQREGIKKYAYEINTTIQPNELLLTYQRSVPQRYFYGDSNTVSKFLRGLFSANGSVVDNRVTLKTSSSKLRDEVQIMLSSIGIRSYYTTNKPSTVDFSNGSYICKESYDINISSDRDVFFEKVGFIQKYKMTKLKNTLSRIRKNNKTHNIISVKHISTEEVFDITVDNETHTYWTGGLNVSNCGEIYMHEDSCRLIHVNLTSFVDNPFTDEACINDERLYEITYEAMHLGDDLVDLEANAIKKILNKIEKDGDINNSEYKLYKRLLSHTLEGRRCGLGFTGLADMIAMMGLKYDSDASLSIINHVMRLMFIAEMDAQIDMAITRGHFDGQDFKLEQDGNTWYKFLEDNFNNIYQKMMKYGRRNISFNTVAPTGTVSLMAKCSSGIEPIFLPFYTRRRKCMSEGDRVDFVDQVGEKYTEFVVVHPTFGKWVESRFNELSEETLNEWKSEDWTAAYKISPWYESTANDINWEKRVELQGIVQKYITHSISSTVNLPNNVTEKEVSNIYIKSWKNQLKGITCYRDGCRSGVLVSTKTETKTEENNNNKVCINNQPVSKRPKEIPCKIFRFSNKGEKWVGVVGLVDDRPYEIFTGILEKLNIPNWVEDGFIVRNKEKRIIDGEEKLMSRYDICYIDKDGYKTCVEGLSRTFNSEYWNYAKLISGLLRHRMPLPYLIKIISSLNLDASNINTWKNGVIRTLRKFNDYNIEEGHYDVCPECGGRLLNENGCYRCLDCGYSKCG